MFLLVALLVLISWYSWRIYAPYSKFRNLRWMDWQFIFSVLRQKGPQNMPLMSFMFQKLVDLCKKYETEGMCVIWSMEPTLLVYGEETVKFFSNEPTLNNKPKIYNVFDLFGEHVELSSSGERWKKIRRMISPSFATSTLKNVVPVMNKHAISLVQQLANLQGNITNEMEEIISVNVLGLFFETTMDIKRDNAENEYKIKRLAKVISELLEFVGQRFLRPWLHFDIMLYFSSAARKRVQLYEELKYTSKQVLEELMEKVRSRRQSSKQLETDTTFDVSHHRLLGEDTFEEYMKDSSVTMETLRDHLIATIFGGFHTVTQTLIWCIWLLGLHEDIQERAYEEIMSVTVGDFVQYEDAQRMTYLECVIKESMRLYPIAPVFARCSKEDIQFGIYTVPKGTTIAFCSYLLHRNPKIYPEPETFNPDRFAETDSNRKPWMLIPFAESVRPCLGKNFSMLEMKIILAHMLRNFKIISLDRKEDVVVTWEVLLKSDKPLRFQFVPR